LAQELPSLIFLEGLQYNGTVAINAFGLEHLGRRTGMEVRAGVEIDALAEVPRYSKCSMKSGAFCTRINDLEGRRLHLGGIHIFAR
jgi:hypothetical protein